MGHNSVDRVKTLLGKLESMKRSEEQESSTTDERECLSGKFAGQVEKIFKNLPNPLEWQSFYTNDLNLIVDICIEAQRHRMPRFNIT